MTYILIATSDHFKGDNYRDVKIRNTGQASSTRKFMLTGKKKVELVDQTFEADLMIDSIEGRDALLNDKSWPVFSPKMMAVLQAFNLPYRVFPVKLFSNKKELSTTYSGLQIKRQKGLVDLDKSVYVPNSLLPEVFSTVDKLEFNDQEPDHPLFRPYEIFEHLVVKEELKTAMEAAEIQGIKFVPTNDYNSTTLY